MDRSPSVTQRAKMKRRTPSASAGQTRESTRLLMTDLPLPTHFEKTVELIEPTKITEDVILGPEPQRHIDAINKFVDAGFDHVYVHQIGLKQEQFFRFYTEKVLPKFSTTTKSSNGSARHDRNRGREREAGAECAQRIVTPGNPVTNSKSSGW